MNHNNTFTNLFNTRTIARSLQRVSAVAVITMTLFLPSAAFAQQPAPDLGDAPDSSNHFAQKMEAYPGSGVIANYPSVYDDPAGIPGPIHWYSSKDSWLGTRVSDERDADLLPDSDGKTNIDPSTGEADRDGYDDGVYLNTLVMEMCKRTEFRYNVSVALNPGPDRYVNVWFDFNRDGDWDDTLVCTQGKIGYFVPEWAVQNQMLPSGLLPGSYNFATPQFWAADAPSTKNPMWMRITLSEQKAPLAPGSSMADGRGIPLGYRTGETEDYLLVK